MAGGLLFVSQAMLDSWADQGKIDFVGNVMTLLQGEGKGRSYALDPAVRFLKVIGAEADPHRLVAKVKQVSHLRDMGAEQVENSVIVGDIAYEVEPGFLAEVSVLQAAAAAQPSATGRVRVEDSTSKAEPSAPPARGRPEAPVPPVPAAPPPSAEKTGGPPPRPGARPPPLPRDLEEKRKEAEALARFLLDNLS